MPSERAKIVACAVRPPFDNQGTHALTFQLGNDRRQQLVGNNDAAIVKDRTIRQPTLLKVIQEASAHIVQIGGPLAEVGIIEALEQCHQVFDRLIDGRLHIHSIFEAKLTDRIA